MAEQPGAELLLGARHTAGGGALPENASPATRLLEKWRQIFEVQEALETQKQDFARKEEVFRRREEALKKKDLELQESLIRFSKFLQENDSKRARAEKKAGDEVRARLAKEREVAQLGEVLEGMREEKEAVDDVLEAFMPYQRYLEGVLEVADEYQEVGDLLARRATLKATNDDLRAHHAACTAEAEALRAGLAAFVRAKTDELLTLNNTLAKLKKQLEAHKQDAALQESRKDRAMHIASQRTLAYGQVVLSTDNIFARCRARSAIAQPPLTAPLAQLEVIANMVSDLLVITRRGSGSGSSSCAATGLGGGAAPAAAAAAGAAAAGPAAAAGGTGAAAAAVNQAAAAPAAAVVAAGS